MAKRRFLGYIRVSTSDQRQGLRAQRDAIQATADAIAQKVGAKVIWFVDDGVSGAKPWQKRPALSDLLLGLKKHDVLIVQRRDRLARDAVQAMLIDRLVRKHNASIESADGARWDDTPESKLIRGILDLFSQYERDLISLRTKRALRAKRLRGERHGGHIPYGMRLNDDDPNKLEVNPLEYAVLKKWIMDPIAEGKSFRDVRRMMWQGSFIKQHPPRYGKKWSLTTIYRIWRYHNRRLQEEALARGQVPGEEHEHDSDERGVRTDPEPSAKGA